MNLDVKAMGRPVQLTGVGAGGGIRTHERLRDKVLSLAPLTKLGNPCNSTVSTVFRFIILFVPPIKHRCSRRKASPVVARTNFKNTLQVMDKRK